MTCSPISGCSDRPVAAAPRVASLVPSGTDIVAALGLGSLLVGVSHACDHPLARGLPVLTSSSVDGHASAAAIDDQVRAGVAAGEPLYRTDAGLLASLAPDVVIAQDICDVCAVPGGQAAAAVPPEARLVMLRGASLAGLEDDVRAVGGALNASARADRQVEALRSAHARLRERVGGLDRPRTLALEWGDPPFLGGHWVPELVQLAGGTHVLTGPGEPSRRSTWQDVAVADPDVIVFMPCGYQVEQATAEARELVARPDVGELRAVRDGRLWATDATRLFSRLTPAVVTAALVLASLLHPGHFPPVGPRRAVAISP